MALDDPNLLLRFWKPHGVMTAFTDRDGRSTLGDFIDVPDVYAAGRLDKDSEGLLLLARGKNLRSQLMRPDIGHPRSYLVQVEGVPDEGALTTLRGGLILKDGKTRPATVELLDNPPDLPERVPPIRIRLSVPDSWIRLTLTEGRNRQVRRMTAAVGFPTLRLVRQQIGGISLTGLSEGEWEVVNDTEREHLTESLRRRAKAGSTSRPGDGRRRSGRRSRG